MTRRSRAREVALQLLYQRDLNPRVDRKAIERFVRDRLRDPAVEPFTLSLYDGVNAQGEDIDRRLSEAAENWRLSRMAAVDRNVLRLGAYELLSTPETPQARHGRPVDHHGRHGGQRLHERPHRSDLALQRVDASAPAARRMVWHQREAAPWTRTEGRIAHGLGFAEGAIATRALILPQPHLPPLHHPRHQPPW